MVRQPRRWRLASYTELVVGAHLCDRERMVRAARSLLVLGIVTSCGRLGFDPTIEHASVDGPVGDSTADGAISGPAIADAILYLPLSSAPQGTSVVDRARGHDVRCAPTGCPRFVPDHGGSFEFVETGPEYLVAAYTADLDPATGFTVAVWVRLTSYPTAANGYACLISKPVGSMDFDSYSLCIGWDAKVLFYTSTTTIQDYLSGSTVPLMSWHHLAITWDGTTKRGYIDGVEVISKPVNIAGDGQAIYIGADFVSGAPQEPTTGRIDEVYVFGRALSGAEVVQLAM